MKVFILTGNSNMEGTGDPSELPPHLRRPQENVRFFVGGHWRGLQPEKRFGPEISFGQAMAEAWPNESIAIVKYAVGGTSLFAWSPDWTPELADKTENRPRGSLYRKLMEQISQALAGRTVQIAAMLWMGSGRDCRYREAAESFEQNYTHFIERVRTDLCTPDLPFIFGQTATPVERGFTFLHLVRQAQMEFVKNVPYTTMVETDGLEKIQDGVHYNTAGNLELGRRFAESFLKQR